MRVEPRPDQAEAIDALQQGFRRYRRQVFQMPTGGGKTVVASVVAERALRAGNPVWFGVHREELVEQSVERMRSQGLHTGVVCAGQPMDLSAQVQVVSIPTLARRAKKGEAAHLPTRPTLFIVDECHHGTAQSWRDAIDYCSGAFVLGLTATPYRLDGRGLGDVFEHMVCGPSPKRLIELGVTVPPVIWSGPAPDMEGVRKLGGDFSIPETAARAASIVGDVVRTWMRCAHGLSTVAFTVNVAHSLAIRDSFRAAGVSAEHVDAETPKEERRAIFQRFKAGDVTLVSNVSIVSEGVNVPDMRCVLMARPTMSLGLYLQMCGRGGRATPGKQSYTLLDHGYNAARHGDPTMDRPLSLTAVRRKKTDPKAAILRNGGEFFRVCERCAMCNPLDARLCISCGQRVRDDIPKVDDSIELVLLSPEKQAELRHHEQRRAWYKFRAMAQGKRWFPRQALAIWMKSHKKSPLDMGLLTSTREKDEYFRWLKQTPPKSEQSSKKSNQSSLFSAS